MSEYVPVKEAAKQIRAALKAAFPGVKFSVRSHTYSGGSSVSVHWTDGPHRAEVDKVAQPLGGDRFVFTERVFSDEYRGELERAVLFLTGERGPFDGAREYSFGLGPGGKVFRSYGDDVVWQLSQVEQAGLDTALEREAKRRAAYAVARFNEEAAEPKAGFYVTVADGGKVGVLLGPYGTKEAAEADVPLGKRLAESVNSRAIWYAYGVTKVTMKPGQDLPQGRLEHLTERQMALAGAVAPVQQAA